MPARHVSEPNTRTTKNPSRFAIPIAIPVTLALVAAGAAVAVNASSHGNLDKTALSRRHPTPTPTASATTPAPPPAANMDCSIVVPPNPLTAQGLATPYQLTGPNGATPAASGCTQTNPNLRAFVEATILDPATGALSVYHPLVITAGTQPAAAPITPKLPNGAVVGIWFGFNGGNLKQILTGRRHRGHLQALGGNALNQGHCVNGLGNSIFGEVSFCNAAGFFTAANTAIADHKLTIPDLGVDKSGATCPTVRSFSVIDQDQSDNVNSSYLIDANGRTAQANQANQATLAGAKLIANGSDDALLTAFLDPTLGCQPFTAPDLSNPGAQSPSQALNELQAAAHQTAPIALVPENDPMVMVGTTMSEQKTNLYRAGVDQPPVSAAQTDDTPANYCTNMIKVQSAELQSQRATLAAGPSPAPDAAQDLFAFLGQRLAGSYTNLGCQALLNAPNPITVTTNSAGVATDVAFGPLAPGSVTPTPTASAQPTPTDSATAAPGPSASDNPTAAPSPTCTPRRGTFRCQ